MNDTRPQPRRPRQGPKTPKAPSAPRHPLLAQLAEWHPTLFGDEPRPLKRGIYEDLLAAHGEALAAAVAGFDVSEVTRLLDHVPWPTEAESVDNPVAPPKEPHA